MGVSAAAAAPDGADAVRADAQGGHGGGAGAAAGGGARARRVLVRRRQQLSYFFVSPSIDRNSEIEEDAELITAILNAA